MALGDGNLDLCLKIMSENLDDRSPLYNEYLNQRGIYNRTTRERYVGLLSNEDFAREYSKLSNWAFDFLSKLTPEHITLLNRIPERLLILTYIKAENEWERMFPENMFSHACVVYYGQDIPLHYRSPDVILFDDTGPPARPHMVHLAAEIPQAHFLYFGESNPFTESRKRNPQDAAIFDRCANANSKFTVHARLRELLEFRKIYGTPK